MLFTKCLDVQKRKGVKSIMQEFQGLGQKKGRQV